MNTVVGKIVKPQGIRGEVKILSLVASPDYFQNFDQLFIDGKVFTVTSCRVHQGFAYVVLDGIADRDFMIILMRRIMMRIAEQLAKKLGAGAIITGENLAQVASQTLESLTVTNAVVDMPVFRPLIGFDKLDIIEVANKIDTYEISILPYEDCCTIFLPKNPVTRPRLDKVLEQEKKLNIDELVAHSFSTHEVVKIRQN